MPDFKAKTDKNHRIVVAGFRQAGYQVFDTHRAGDGFPDIVVLSKSSPPIFVLFEIKTLEDKNGLRGKEIDFFKRTTGAPRFMIQTVENGLKIMEKYDRRSNE